MFGKKGRVQTFSSVYRQINMAKSTQFATLCIYIYILNTSKKKIGQILQIFFNKGENASQVAENMNSIYDTIPVTAKHTRILMT